MVPSRALPLAIALFAGVALLAAAGRFAPAPQAPTVAIVDVTTVLQGLTEFNDRNNEFTAQGEVYKKDLTELADKIKQAENDLQNAIPPSDIKRRAEKLRELYENRALLQARNDGYGKLIEIEQGEVIHALYVKEVAAVAALATTEGIDLVLADDRSGLTQASATFTENRRRMEARKVLFAADSLDITQRVITIMNNDYAAGAAPASPR